MISIIIEKNKLVFTFLGILAFAKSSLNLQYQNYLKTLFQKRQINFCHFFHIFIVARLLNVQPHDQHIPFLCHFIAEISQSHYYTPLRPGFITYLS